MNEQMKLPTANSTLDWTDDIINSFPKGIKCLVCLQGEFELGISGAVARGSCNKCGTSVLYQFYETRYPYLDEISKRDASRPSLEKRIAELEKALKSVLDAADNLDLSDERNIPQAAEIFDAARSVLAKGE